MSSVEQDQQEQKACPECGALQKVNRDGSLRKHPGADGETCQQRESVDAPAEQPVVDEWPEGDAPDPAADDDAPGTDAQSDDAEPAGDGGDGRSDEDDSKPAEPPAGPAVAPAEPDPGTYRWTMTVRHPALYLGDAEWHQANADLAAIRAQEAGHTVTGEARWDGGIGGGEDEGTVQLTYLVPVQA